MLEAKPGESRWREPSGLMFVLSELSFCLFDVLGMGMVCVYIGCHSGNGGDVNVLMTGKVQVQPTKRRNGLRLLEPADETTQLIILILYQPFQTYHGFNIFTYFTLTNPM